MSKIFICDNRCIKPYLNYQKLEELKEDGIITNKSDPIIVNSNTNLKFMLNYRQIIDEYNAKLDPKSRILNIIISVLYFLLIATAGICEVKETDPCNSARYTLSLTSAIITIIIVVFGFITYGYILYRIYIFNKMYESNLKTIDIIKDIKVWLKKSIKKLHGENPSKINVDNFYNDYLLSNSFLLEYDDKTIKVDGNLYRYKSSLEYKFPFGKENFKKRSSCCYSSKKCKFYRIIYIYIIFFGNYQRFR